MSSSLNQIKAPRIGAFFIALLLALFTSAATSTETVVVKTVIDGDTVILMNHDVIRLIGINAPEIAHDERAAEPLSEAARARLTELVRGRPVRLESGREPYDHYHRHLASLTLMDGRSVEALLVAEGLAFVIAIPPNIAALERLQTAEAQARARGVGIWSQHYYAARDAAALHSGDTGFARVRGRVQRVIHVSHGWYLPLAPHFSLYIPRSAAQYFAAPAAWSGKLVEARGWISEHDGRLRMKIEHPAMLQTIDAKS